MQSIVSEWRQLKAEFETRSRTHWTALIIGFDLALIGFAIAPWFLLGGGTLSYFLALCGSLIVLTHVYVLKHEASHQAFAQNRAVNDFVGQLLGALILMPFLTRQRSHLLHHMWTGHPVGDPSNARMIRRFTAMNADQAKRLEAIWSSWLPLIAINDRVGLWLDPLLKYSSGSPSGRIKKEIFWHVTYWIAYLCVGAVLIQKGLLPRFCLLMIPAWMGLFMIEELINLPHHAETPLQSPEEKASPLWEQQRFTHSCKTVPIWSRWVLLNFNQHTAHHLFPSLPWYHLELAQEELYALIPGLREQQQKRSEWGWSLKMRKRPLLSIMGHYFDRRVARDSQAACESAR